MLPTTQVKNISMSCYYPPARVTHYQVCDHTSQAIIKKKVFCFRDWKFFLGVEFTCENVLCEWKFVFGVEFTYDNVFFVRECFYEIKVFVFRRGNIHHWKKSKVFSFPDSFCFRPIAKKFLVFWNQNGFRCGNILQWKSIIFFEI